MASSEAVASAKDGGDGADGRRGCGVLRLIVENLTTLVWFGLPVEHEPKNYHEYIHASKYPNLEMHDFHMVDTCS